MNELVLISVNVERLSAKSAEALKSTGTLRAEVNVVVNAARGKPLAKVFHFETDSPGEVMKEFDVTDEVITKGKQSGLVF